MTASILRGRYTLIGRHDISAIYEFHHQIKGDVQREINGRMVRFNGEDDYLVICDLEKLAREIEKESRQGREPTGFVIEPNELGVVVPRPRALAWTYYSAVATLVSHLVDLDRYNWSQYVWAVREAVRAAGINSEAFEVDFLTGYVPGLYCARREHKAGIATAQAFNMLLGKISEVLGSSEFARRMNSRRRNAERNLKSALAVEQRAFSDQERRFVLLICLGFSERYRSKLTLKEMKKFRSRFFRNRFSNTLLRGIVDYIWRIDDDESTGLHLQLIIIYAPRSSTDTIARQIGEYWKNNITGGKGAYWFCTAYTASHTKDGYPTGVGEIDRGDDVGRAALRGILHRMAEAELIMRMRCNERSRMFGTSQGAEKAG